MYEIVVGLLLEVVLPAALTSLVLLGAAGFFCNAKWREALLPLALAAGLMAGCYYRELLFYVPESFGWNCLLTVVLETLVASFVCQWLPHPAARIGIPCALAAQFSTCFVTATVDTPRSAWQMLGLALAVSASAVVLSMTTQRHKRPIAPLTGMLWLLGSATMLAVYGSARLADSTTALASALLGAGLLASYWSLPLTNLVPSGVLFSCGIMFASYGDNSEADTHIKNLCYLLIGLAPLPLAITFLPAFGKASPIARLALEAICIAIFPITAIALAIYYAGLPLPV